MSSITIFHYLFLGLAMFIIGLLGSIFSKHVIKILISIEFILTGININFVTFASFCDQQKYNGYVFALFYVALGAVELAIALYIFYLMYHNKKSENIESYGEL